MKRILVFILLSITSITIIEAQETNLADSSYNKSYIYLDPSQTAFYTFQLGYERAFAENKRSLLICIGYYRENNNSTINTGFSEEIQYRVFVSSDTDNPDSKFNFDFYFAPYLNHKSYSYHSTKILVGGIVGGLRFSYQNFAADLSCGGGYKTIYNHLGGFFAYNGYQEYADIGYTGILPKLALRIGYTF